MALSITSATSETAARVLSGLEQLRGCDAFFSVIISPTDETVLRKLGINVCCEPKFERRGFFPSLSLSTAVIALHFGRIGLAPGTAF